MPKYRVVTRWNHGRGQSRLVECSDACEALDYALPGQWQIGQYESAEVTIARVPDDTPMEDA